MERYAAIDIGTNSVRILICGYDGGNFYPELFELRSSRIGEGMGESKKLQERPVARTVQALREFSGFIDSFGVCKKRVVATSAVREAVNSVDFLRLVRRETGLEVEVIEGEEEAYLNYLGVCQALPEAASGVIVDIGGGSTEFTCGAKPPYYSNCRCFSIPLGAVRLAERPLLLDDILAVFKDVLEAIKESAQRCLVGVGGTITTLAAIDQALEVYDAGKVQGYYLSTTAVQSILLRLAAKNKEERCKIPGLQKERADIIVAGTTILWAILCYLQALGITVSEADILDGIIAKLAEGV